MVSESGIIPYFAEAGWYSAWLHGRLGMASLSRDVSPRDYARCRIGSGESPLVLSVPVVGGARSIRSMQALPKAAVSGHGNWAHVHLGALEAVYGRSPYFMHLFPEIRDILSSPPKLLSELNLRLHRAVLKTMGIPSDASLECLRASLTPRAMERGRELSARISPGLSILEAVMEMGPETVLVLI